MKSIKCQYCSKKIEGHTQKQIEWLMKVHKHSNHEKEFWKEQADLREKSKK